MSALRRLMRHCGGASAAEFALVLPLLIMFLFGAIDVGRLMWTWNRAEKATQMGVRYAVVTDMVPEDLASHNFATGNGVPGGDPVPTSEFSSTTCDTADCTGGWGHDQLAFGRVVDRMNAIMPEIGDANVEIDYENVGLGYAGDPHGPDVAPLVTVRLTGLTFQPLTTLIFGTALTMPDFRAALTLEDGSGTVAN